MAPPLNVADRVRLLKIAGMLGSAIASERAVAALKATELLQSHGLTWASLLSQVLVPEPRRYLTRPETRLAAAKMGSSL